MTKLSKKKFRAAIKDTMGSITSIAINCKVDRNTVYAFLKKHPELQDDIQNEIDRIKDLAESRVKSMALDKNMKALKFFLERKCGWIPKQQIEMESKNETKIDLSEFENYAKKSEPDNTTSDTESDQQS